MQQVAGCPGADSAQTPLEQPLGNLDFFFIYFLLFIFTAEALGQILHKPSTWSTTSQPEEQKGQVIDFICSVLCPGLISMPCILSDFFQSWYYKSRHPLQASQILFSKQQMPGLARLNEFLGVCKLSPKAVQRYYKQCAS